METPFRPRRTLNLLLLSDVARQSPERHRFFETVPMAYSLVARARRVPLDLIYAMTFVLSQDTPQKCDSDDLRIPWPWVLVVDDRPIRFNSLSSARLALRRLNDSKRKVQLGLMRIRYQSHSDMTLLLCPLENLSFTAQRLRRYFEETGDWWLAVRLYTEDELGYTPVHCDEFVRQLKHRIHRPFENSRNQMCQPFIHNKGAGCLMSGVAPKPPS